MDGRGGVMVVERSRDEEETWPTSCISGERWHCSMSASLESPVAGWLGSEDMTIWRWKLLFRKAEESRRRQTERDWDDEGEL